MRSTAITVADVGYVSAARDARFDTNYRAGRSQFMRLLYLLTLIFLTMEAPTGDAQPLGQAEGSTTAAESAQTAQAKYEAMEKQMTAMAQQLAALTQTLAAAQAPPPTAPVTAPAAAATAPVASQASASTAPVNGNAPIFQPSAIPARMPLVPPSGATNVAPPWVDPSIPAHLGPQPQQQQVPPQDPAAVQASRILSPVVDALVDAA